MSDRFKKAEANKVRDKALKACGESADEARAAWQRVLNRIPQFEGDLHRNYKRQQIERDVRLVMLQALADGRGVEAAEQAAIEALA